MQQLLIAFKDKLLTTTTSRTHTPAIFARVQQKNNNYVIIIEQQHLLFYFYSTSSAALHQSTEATVITPFKAFKHHSISTLDSTMLSNTLGSSVY